MKKIIIVLTLVVIFYGLEFVLEQDLGEPAPSSPGQYSNNDLREAYKNRQSDVQVRGQGTVLRILPDDNDGSRHQRIILELDSGQSLLIAHNIDLTITS